MPQSLEEDFKRKLKASMTMETLESYILAILGRFQKKIERIIGFGIDAGIGYYMKISKEN